LQVGVGDEVAPHGRRRLLGRVVQLRGDDNGRSECLILHFYSIDKIVKECFFFNFYSHGKILCTVPSRRGSWVRIPNALKC
jgi:hypothetical protein